jgi:hypothetical protein
MGTICARVFPSTRVSTKDLAGSASSKLSKLQDLSILDADATPTRNIAIFTQLQTHTTRTQYTHTAHDTLSSTSHNSHRVPLPGTVTEQLPTYTNPLLRQLPQDDFLGYRSRHRRNRGHLHRRLQRHGKPVQQGEREAHRDRARSEPGQR